MSTFSINSGLVITEMTWPELKILAHRKLASVQYVENDDIYQMYIIDGISVAVAMIYRGTVPPESGIDQAVNDGYKIDFENLKVCLNKAIIPGGFGDTRIKHRFGNQVNLAVTESLVYGRIYREPPSQAQRSVVSTSASDSNPAGVGAKKVLIEYLNSNYVLKREEVALSGTTPVNTVSTDIRFIQDFYVSAGTAAVGAIRLMSGTAGSGTEITGIGSGADSAYLCHHYMPSGSRGMLKSWGATVSDDAQMRLKSQRYVSGSLVDIVIDLDMMVGIVSGSRLDFERKFDTLEIQEKTYTRVTAHPGQSTSTTVRARMDVWQDLLYVSGTA